jgi:hypothetical protein
LFVPAHGIRSDGDLVTLLYEGDVDYGGQLQVTSHRRSEPVP